MAMTQSRRQVPAQGRTQVGEPTEAARWSPGLGPSYMSDSGALWGQQLLCSVLNPKHRLQMGASTSFLRHSTVYRSSNRKGSKHNNTGRVTSK